MAPRFWLSVLLPVYNVESYLATCLDSVLNQIGHDNGVQIVIVDDASTDNSCLIAEAFRSQYPHCIKVLRHRVNQGVSAARNRLVDEADGEHIWFVDPDDYILAGAIGALRDVLRTHDPDLILCDYRKSKWFKTRSFFGPNDRLSCDVGQLLAGVFKSRKMYCWLKISRGSLWNDVPHFPEGRIFEDIATTPWLLLKARNYYYVPSPWIFYRQRAGSIMDSVKRKAGVFDARKHRDLAQALIGFKEAMSQRIKDPHHSAEYYISDFCAKEFVKTAFRFARSGGVAHNEPVVQLDYYLDEFKKCTPIQFEKLAVQYLKRLRFIRFALLKYALHLANRSQILAVSDTGLAQ